MVDKDYFEDDDIIERDPDREVEEIIGKPIDREDAPSANEERKEAPKKETPKEEPAVATKKVAPMRTPSKKSTAKGKKPLVKTAEPLKKTAMKKKAKKDSHIPLITTIIILVLAVIAAVVIITNFNQNSENSQELVSTSNAILVAVNGVPITQNELDTAYAQLPVALQQQVSKDDWLERMINQELLRQEATSKNIVVSDDEVNAFVNNILLSNGITEEEFRTQLTQQGISYEEYLTAIREQILFTKLFDEVLPEYMDVTDENLQELYAQRTPVVVRHILLSQPLNETDEEFEARAQAILDQVTPTRDNFCDLVTEYSEDTGSVGTCGEYTYDTNTNFVPEFKEAGFDMNVNELRLVESEFGYHIMYKVRDLPFEEAKEQLRAEYEAQASNEALDEYLADLMASATIERAITDVTGAVIIEAGSVTQANVVTTPDADVSVTGEENVAQNTIEVVDSTSASDADELLAQIQEQQASGIVDINAPINAEDEIMMEETTVEEVPLETQEDDEGPSAVLEDVMEELEEIVTPEVVTPTAPDPLSQEVSVFRENLVDCMNDKGVALYGAYWSSQTRQQLLAFGNEAANINYIECFLPGQYSNAKPICDSIEAYPTWLINGEQHLGIQSVERLKKLTSC